ncbi:MAG: FeoC-like transcriptional regulator [Gammaproteobacteria bacterium]|nr:FeoC-like transcriptional regulator [Gammaproteobacteria bacterium]
MLIDLKQYVKNQRLVSLYELSSRFNLDPEIMRSMLDLLIRKGQIRPRNKTNNCGSKCFKCNPLSTELYEWIS